ncbi:MAG: hypothetical protein ABI425_03120 [Patescibacteria group bacterium]
MSNETTQAAWVWIEQQPDAKKVLHKYIGEDTSKIADPDFIAIVNESGFTAENLLSALIQNDASASAVFQFLIPDC